MHTEPKQHLPGFQIARRPLKRYLPTNPAHMTTLKRLRVLLLIGWLYIVCLACFGYIPSFRGAKTNPFVIVALILILAALELIRWELRDLRESVTKKDP